MLYVAHDWSSLTETTVEIFKNFDPSKETYIDSEGHVFKIVSAEHAGYRGIFGWNFFLKGTQIKIKLDFSPDVGNIELSDFKDIVIDRLNRKKKFWEESWDFSELISKIKSASNYVDIINLIE